MTDLNVPGVADTCLIGLKGVGGNLLSLRFRSLNWVEINCQALIKERQTLTLDDGSNILFNIIVTAYTEGDFLSISINYCWQSWQLSDLELPLQLPVPAEPRRNPSRTKSLRRWSCCCSPWWASLFLLSRWLASRHKGLILRSRPVQPSLWSLCTSVPVILRHQRRNGESNVVICEIAKQDTSRFLPMIAYCL